MIYVVAFDPNKILTRLTHQNDSQNLSFVKAINVVGQKMARNGHKTAIYESYQNDSQNLSFVKAINVVGRKMTRNTHEMANF